jgi:peptidoglycan hydrolase CwlO-like protein
LFEIDKKNFEDINLRIKIKRMHIESLESYVKELKEENEQLESKITQKDDMIETLSSELDSKADECISCETDNKKLKSKIETLNNTFDKSKARLEYYRGLADGQERLINTLLKINSALTSKLLQ